MRTVKGYTDVQVDDSEILREAINVLLEVCKMDDYKFVNILETKSAYIKDGVWYVDQLELECYHNNIYNKTRRKIRNATDDEIIMWKGLRKLQKLIKKC